MKGFGVEARWPTRLLPSRPFQLGCCRDGYPTRTLSLLVLSMTVDAWQSYVDILSSVVGIFIPS